MKRLIWMSLVLLLAVALCIFIALGLIANFTTPFEIKIKGERAKVDVSTLGEYPTSVSRIRLSEQDSGKVLWELTSGHRSPQIWGFTLRVGANSVQVVDTAQNHKYQAVYSKV